MNIESQKALLIKEIQSIEDESLLKIIRNIIHYGMKNEGRISIEQYNKELDEADNEISSGQFISHDELKKQMKSW